VKLKVLDKIKGKRRPGKAAKPPEPAKPSGPPPLPEGSKTFSMTRGTLEGLSALSFRKTEILQHKAQFDAKCAEHLGQIAADLAKIDEAEKAIRKEERVRCAVPDEVPEERFDVRLTAPNAGEWVLLPEPKDGAKAKKAGA